MMYLACFFGGASLGLLTAAMLVSARVADAELERDHLWRLLQRGAYDERPSDAEWAERRGRLD